MRLSELAEFHSITIQCHDNPDADTLASGYGLYCYFQSRGNQVRLVYSGKNQIQKSNLKLMIETLSLPIEYIPVPDGEVLQLEGLLITVDCQYGAGNVTGLAAKYVAIIDHHQVDQIETDSIEQIEIQPNLGSCATLVWKLLLEEGFPVTDEKGLGTALYYGLYSDTNQFAEIYNPLDMDMRDALPVDKSLITRFRNANISLKELEIAGIAMLRCSYNEEYKFAVIKAQPCDPNILGLISDFLLQVDAIDTCVVFNQADDGYKFSVRSCIKEVNASELAAFLAEDIGSGGGHYEKAGGFISRRRYMKVYLNLHTEGYFNNRMLKYFESYEIIYASQYQVNLQKMKTYRKRRIPIGYVEADKVLAVGTPITVRTLEGDISMTVEEDLYIMIGMKGEVYPKRRKRFQEAYTPLEKAYHPEEMLYRTEYTPVIKDGKSGRDIQLTDVARVCIPKEEIHIHARVLEKGVKIFTDWDKNHYMLGRPGDYLAVRCDDLQDVFVVEKDIFIRGYEEETGLHK